MSSEDPGKILHFPDNSPRIPKIARAYRFFDAIAPVTPEESDPFLVRAAALSMDEARAREAEVDTIFESTTEDDWRGEPEKYRALYLEFISLIQRTLPPIPKAKGNGTEPTKE